MHCADRHRVKNAYRRGGQLPNKEHEVFDLLWYQGLTQDEAAQLLGVSKRTIKRRWQSARLQLFEALGGHLPE
jgi:RNA polymerase sigma factor (sigma-70 family)